MVDSPVILLTGAARGLGRVMAKALADAGCRLVLSATTESGLRAMVQEEGLAGAGHAIVTADLSHVGDCDRLVRAAHDHFGRVDVLINNAAFTPEHIWLNVETEGEPLPWTIDLDTARRFFEINTLAPHHLTSATLPGMVERGWGRIVNISTSLDTMLRFWPYGATKAAIEAYTAVLSTRLEGSGVTANALLPGGLTKAEPLHDPKGGTVRPVLPPSNMIAPIRWLCSHASDGITGLRIVAAKWDATLPNRAALEHASSPVAWTGLGAQAARPDD